MKNVFLDLKRVLAVFLIFVHKAKERISRFSIILVVSCICLSLPSCQKARKYFDKLRVHIYDPLLGSSRNDRDKCNPTKSMYEENQHYIDWDYITENGVLDQKRWWNKDFLPYKSPCDPFAPKHK